MRGFQVGEHHWRGPLREAHGMFQQLASIAAGYADECKIPKTTALGRATEVDRLIETVGNLPRAPRRSGCCAPPSLGWWLQ